MLWNRDKLVRLRKDLGETQGEFAERIGVSIDTLQNWEQGRIDVPTLAGKLFDRISADVEAPSRKAVSA